MTGSADLTWDFRNGGGGGNTGLTAAFGGSGLDSCPADGNIHAEMDSKMARSKHTQQREDMGFLSRDILGRFRVVLLDDAKPVSEAQSFPS